MSWKDPAERHNDAVIDAIDKASHRIATAIQQGFIHMADKQSQALTDLNNAVTNIGAAIAAEIAALQAALSAQGVDDSPQIETAVANLNNLAGSLKASVTTPVAPPAVTAVSPASGPVAGNTTVTVSGTGFTGETGVIVGGTDATAVTLLNDTTLTAVTPAGTAGPQDVIVTTPGGASKAGNGAFTYV